MKISHFLALAGLILNSIASIAAAINLPNGGSVTGEISVQFEEDQYHFDAVAGQYVRLRVARTDDSGLTPKMELRDPSGALIGSDSFGALDRRVDSSGTYTVTIRDNTTGRKATGAYVVYFVEIPGANERGPLMNGGVRSDYIDLVDLDSYVFYARAGESVRLRVTSTDQSGLIPQLKMYDPTGSKIWSDSFGVISATLEASGTYTVVVADNTTVHKATGAYNVYFVKVPGANEYGNLINGGVRTGYIDVRDLDSYTFFANAGESVHLDIERSEDSGLTPRIELFDSNGLRVGLGSLGTAINLTLSATGTYSVVVADFTTGHSATGAYSVGFALSGERLSYAALGDSFSSGEGLYPYQDPNDWYLTFPDPLSDIGLSLSDLGIDGGCHRSYRAYAYQIRLPGDQGPLANQPDTDMDFFACTGAQTKNITVGGEPLHGEPYQLSVGNAIDGSRDLVTISIGGNDAQFVKMAEYCMAQRDCVHQQPFAPYAEFTLQDVAPLWIQYFVSPKIREVHRQIHDLATNATIVVFGYPILVSGNECGAVILPGAPVDRLSTDEQMFLRQTNADLNSVVAASAAAVGLHFVSVAEAFKDHEICDVAENWINGIDVFNPAGSFHPTARGQTEYANAFNAYMNGIATAWPNGYSDKGLPRNPTPVSAVSAQLQAEIAPLPRFGTLGVRLVAIPDDCHSADGLLVPGQVVKITGRDFEPGEPVQLSLMVNGERVALGSATADAEGAIVQEVLMPEGLVPGTSGSVEALGAGQNGAGLLLLTIYRVEADASLDSDGDGVLDLCDNCSTASNSDQRDTDRDGYGNICDADLDNNGIVNTFDLARFKAAFGTSGDLDEDLDGNFVVNTFDLARFKSLFGKTPGPAFGR